MRIFIVIIENKSGSLFYFMSGARAYKSFSTVMCIYKSNYVRVYYLRILHKNNIYFGISIGILPCTEW